MPSRRAIVAVVEETSINVLHCCRFLDRWFCMAFIESAYCCISSRVSNVIREMLCLMYCAFFSSWLQFARYSSCKIERGISFFDIDW